MKRKHKIFYSLLIAFALAIVCLVTFFYLRQLNRTVSDNIINSISEIAEHDKQTIQYCIETSWNNLQQIRKRFNRYGCKTIRDIETCMNLECSASDFTHIYLIAEDGTVYTDQYAAYPPDTNNPNSCFDFLSLFSKGKDHMIARFDDNIPDAKPLEKNILYGIRLKDFAIDNTQMAALIGVSSVSSIQDNMVIDSFIRDGKSRGYSALIDLDGNFIVNVNKDIMLSHHTNLFEHLSEAAFCELTNQEISRQISRSETFGFYHAHKAEKYKELYYLIPFNEKIDLYFVMSVAEEVFAEQTGALTTMSIATLAVSMLTVISMLLIVMKNRFKTIAAAEKARAQKEFLSNMSHEIRTPLNGLIGINHLIMVHIDDNSQKPQIKEWLKKSHGTANYLLSLVNDILDMSKLQAGKVDIIDEPLLIDGLIDEIAAMQADNIKSRGVEFIVEKDIPFPCVNGDATRTKQILMNIVGNAAKFTPKGKYIRLSANQKKTDDLHVITTYRCEDTGIGISKEYLSEIFDSFSQEKNRKQDGAKGTGLGMAISKLLANAMGGDITVESELNVGSVFTVTIPSRIVTEIPDYLANRADPAAHPKLPLQKPDGKPLNILVAEDVELNAEVLLEILSMEGYKTAHAGNGQEAVDLFRNSETGEFDIILMDMEMPVMDGCSAACQIRKLNRPDAKSVIIYACTANTFQEDRELALKSGMDGFLTKPIDINDMLQKLNSCRK